ncbi:MAG TPA: radical SAM protein [Anaerolineaceae bacterium]
MNPPPIQTDVFIIPILETFLVYAPLRRVAFFTNPAGVNLLERLRHGPIEPETTEQDEFLRFCAEIKLTGSEGDFPITTFDVAEYLPNEVTLFLTTRCNLRCVYCYADGGETPERTMTLETAKRGIDFVCQSARARGLERFGVGYHGGGEPTQNWRVLTESFAYAKELAKANGMEVYGSMATNGVLTPAKRAWIIENFAGVNLSVDGCPTVQDAQRPTPGGKGSSRAVLETMRAFDAAGFPYGVRLTVTAQSVDRLPESVAYLLEHGHPKRMQVEPVYTLGRGKAGGLAVDSQGFVEAYLEAKQIAAPTGVDFYYSAARLDVLTNRFCQSCGEGFSLTPSGLVSSCYEVPDDTVEYAERFLLGNFDEQAGQYRIDGEKLARLRDYRVEQIAWCQDCFCKWHCGGDCMYKSQHSLQEGVFAGDPRCEVTRALTLDLILERIRQSGGKVWAGNLEQASPADEPQYSLEN